jgi:hypothetical protein
MTAISDQMSDLDRQLVARVHVIAVIQLILAEAIDRDRIVA